IRGAGCRAGDRGDAHKADPPGVEFVKRHVEPPIEDLSSSAGLQVGDDQRIATESPLDQNVMGRPFLDLGLESLRKKPGECPVLIIKVEQQRIGAMLAQIGNQESGRCGLAGPAFGAGSKENRRHEYNSYSRVFRRAAASSGGSRVRL